ncbi:putative adipose-regulatory protein-domain-containing protein [Choanephora cucurbitarum]|nr:putative adipose-regulatory protein-domain-containing protein [Choanephora cucurbitarum]
MAKTFSDTDDYSDQGLNPDFHVVPSSHYSEDEEMEDRVSTDELLRPAVLEQPQIKPIEWHPVILMMARFVKALCGPIVRLVFAPKTQKTIVQSIVMTIVIGWILLTSFTAYITFYQRYIPKTAHVEPIYFQYDSHLYPQSTIQLKGPHPSMPLRNDQRYDVSIQLHVPTSDVNFDLGNFMVHVELKTENGTCLAESSRPAILRYQSYTHRILHVLAKAIPLLIGWAEESQHIHIPLIESYIEKKATPLTQATVSISTPKLQIYKAQLSVIADFKGLRYYMYHKRMTTAFIFIFLFTFIEVVFTFVAWNMFGKNLWDKLQEAFSTDELHVLPEQEDHLPPVEEDESYLTDNE